MGLVGYFNTRDDVPSGSSTTQPLQTKILPGGNDYARASNNGSLKMEVSTAAQGINVTSMFHISSYGYMGPGHDHSYDHETTFGELDGWHSIGVNTDSTEYGWLNNALLFGEERVVIRDGAARVVELRVFRVEVRAGKQ
ncbi:hypothetical protein ACJZ2D_007498 [Fusarium nematophilum]